MARGLSVLVVVVVAVVHLPEVLALGLEPEQGPEHGGHDEPGAEHEGDRDSGLQGRVSNLPG